MYQNVLEYDKWQQLFLFSRSRSDKRFIHMYIKLNKPMWVYLEHPQNGFESFFYFLKKIKNLVK